MGFLLKLKKNVNIEKKGNFGLTPFLIAVQYGKLDVATLLYEKGADIHATIDDEKVNALHLATRPSGNFDPKKALGLVTFLIEKGVSCNSKDEASWTLLHNAAMENLPKVVVFLIEKGANICAVTKYDMTPLHWATKEGHENIGDILIKGQVYQAIIKKAKDSFDRVLCILFCLRKLKINGKKIPKDIRLFILKQPDLVKDLIYGAAYGSSLDSFILDIFRRTGKIWLDQTFVLEKVTSISRPKILKLLQAKNDKVYTPFMLLEEKNENIHIFGPIGKGELNVNLDLLLNPLVVSKEWFLPYLIDHWGNEPRKDGEQINQNAIHQEVEGKEIEVLTKNWSCNSKILLYIAGTCIALRLLIIFSSEATALKIIKDKALTPCACFSEPLDGTETTTRSCGHKTHSSC